MGKYSTSMCIYQHKWKFYVVTYTNIEGLVKEWSDVEFSIWHIMQDDVNNLHIFSSIYIYIYI
jgi:hypothetical protein